MPRIVWRGSARRRLREIVEYISDRDPAAAEAFEVALRHGIDRLGAFPQSGRPGRVAGTRELMLHPNYLAIYAVGTDHVVILEILHARRRYP